MGFAALSTNAACCIFTRRTHMSILSRFIKEESGATAIEYGLIAALIAVAAIVAMTQVGQGVTKTFNKVSKQINK
jgi:pilus assembly protein Flp/PilA